VAFSFVAIRSSSEATSSVPSRVFKDGDLPTLARNDQDLLRNARDRVVDVPEILVTSGSLAVPLT
jgi:hypothetical protein